MDYRGTVHGNVIVLDPDVHLPEGQLVDVTPVLPTLPEGELPAAGIWRDRTDLGDTETVARELRQATDRRSS